MQIICHDAYRGTLQHAAPVPLSIMFADLSLVSQATNAGPCL